MHFVGVCVAVGLGFWAMFMSAHANNVFPGTTLSGSSGTVTGTTVGATGETGEPASIGGGNLNTIWYSWTATATGTFTVATCNLATETNTNFDTTLQSFSGNAVNTLTLLAQNDDTNACTATVNPNYASTISFPVTTGASYRIQVDGYTSAVGTYTLRWGLAALVVTTTDNSATEGGDTAAFTVRPQSPPAGGTNIVVTVGTSAQCTFAPTTLTFTNANWTTAQSVTATAIKDTVIEGTHSCAAASLSASGGTYVSITATPPTLTIIDNDIASLALAKTWAFAPGGDANSNGVADVGDVIRYSYAVTNTGTLVLTSVVVNDVHTGAGALGAITPASVASLSPGVTTTFIANYTTVQGDLDAP